MTAPDDRRLTLVDPKRRRSDEPSFSDSVRTRELKVLVVDDNRADLYLLRGALEGVPEAKLRVSEATSYEGALARIKEEPFNLCICDIWLSNGRTGIDLYKATRGLPCLMPFIAVTGHSEEDEVANACLRVGFDDVLIKNDLKRANFYRIVRNSVLRNTYSRVLFEKSEVDELTGLINHRGMLVRLNAERDRAARQRMALSILYLDLNDFKKINDAWGHSAGDLALVHFAKLVRALLRCSDVFARIGGDEFIVGMPATTAREAKELEQRIGQALAATPLRFNEHVIPMTVSVGISDNTTSDYQCSLSDLVERADADMYSNKKGI